MPRDDKDPEVKGPIQGRARGRDAQPDVEQPTTPVAVAPIAPAPAIEADAVPEVDDSTTDLAAAFDDVPAPSVPAVEQPTEEMPASDEAAAVPTNTGFVNITTTPTAVEADFTNLYKSPDRSEVHINTGPGDTTGDNDRDGLSDAAEAKYGTSTSTYDTDYDGLPDGVEVQIGTDPLNKLGDADNDGIPDATEISHGLNPFDADTDDDGISDSIEFDRNDLLAIVPTPGSTDDDWDGDGLSNTIEERYGQNKSIPENQIPEFQAQADRSYELLQQLNPDPVQQAMVAADLQRQLTPEQQAAFDDAVFERGIASADVLLRYSFANQLNVIDGTPVPPELEASYIQAQADLVKALTERDLEAWTSYNTARGITLDAAATDAFSNATHDQLVADGNTLNQLGVDLTTLGNTQLAKSILAIEPGWAETWGTSPSGVTQIGMGGTSTGDATTTTTTATTTTGPSGTGLAGTNQAEGVLDRMVDAPTSPTGSTGLPGATTPTSPSGVTESDQQDVEAPVPAQPATPAPTPTQIADNVGQIADDIAGQIGATGASGDGSSSGLNTGTTTGTQLTDRFDVDEDALTGGSIEGSGTTTTGTTEDGRTYTQTDMGEAGFKREYDDTGTVQFFNTDGTPKGGELHLHADADAGSDDTNTDAGTTDDDGEQPADDDEEEADPDDDGVLDDGTSGEAAVYINPDADVIGMPMRLSPIVAQIVTTGLDPTTTNPSGPYVDDSVAPIAVSSGAVAIGLDVPIHPGVIDGNPDGAGLEIVGTAPIGIDPEGPDTVDPNDPLVGGGGEDINPGDFTPRPSAALEGGDIAGLYEGITLDALDGGVNSGLDAGFLLDEGTLEDGFGLDPDPFG